MCDYWAVLDQGYLHKNLSPSPPARCAPSPAILLPASLIFSNNRRLPQRLRYDLDSVVAVFVARVAEVDDAAGHGLRRSGCGRGLRRGGHRSRLSDLDGFGRPLDRRAA